MKVKFLKSHDVFKVGDIEELPEGLANYLIRCGVVESTEELKVVKKEVKKPNPKTRKPRVKKEKKVIEPDLEKK